MAHLRPHDPFLPFTAPAPQQITLIPHPGRPPTAPRRYRWHHRPTLLLLLLLLDHRRRRVVVVVIGRPVVKEVGTPFADELGVQVVEEGGGGGHAAAEDGGGELGGGPERGRLQVVGLVWVAGVEGYDEAHDGCYAGAVETGFDPLAGFLYIYMGCFFGRVFVQQTHGEDGQDADLAPRGDLKF